MYKRDDQLIRERFSPDGRGIKINQESHRELYGNMNCPIGQSELKNLDYKQKDLVNYFIEYDACLDAAEVIL